MSEERSLAEKAASTSDVEEHEIFSQDAQEVTAKRPIKLVPVVIVAVAALMFATISSFWTSWQNNSSVTTDDAYVRADVVPLSTRAHGIVLKTLVHDYDQVTAGQTLIELRNEDFKDRVSEAQQDVSQVKIKLADMPNRKSKLDAQVDDAKALLDNSRSTLLQFDTTIDIAKSSIEQARAGVDAAAAAIKQTDATVSAATADTVRTQKARHREEALLAEESSTQEKVEQVVDEHARAVASLEGQNSARARATADYLAKVVELKKAKQQLTSTLLDKTKAASGVVSRQAEVTSRIMERKLLDGEEEQLKAQLVAKNSAADSSVIDLGYTTVKAPQAGTVGELKVKPGQFVSAGTQVITLVSSTPWVVANYREVQTAKIKVGDRATITVDAMPGKHWDAHVQGIAPASGAQFSLLPPDNASGNFTKITQRISVKLTFDEQNKDQDKDQDKALDKDHAFSALRPGMSVTASVKPESK